MALNFMNRAFLNFAKSCILSCLSKFDNKKGFLPCPFWNLKAVLLDHTVTTVTMFQEHDNNMLINDWAGFWCHDNRIR